MAAVAAPTTATLADYTAGSRLGAHAVRGQAQRCWTTSGNAAVLSNSGAPAAAPRRGLRPPRTVTDTVHEERQRWNGELIGWRSGGMNGLDDRLQRRGRVRRLASEVLRRHGSAVTYTGNGWREMAAGTVKDDDVARLPDGRVERGRAATGFGHRRLGAGRVAVALDRRCRPGHGRSAPLWHGCMVPGGDGAPTCGPRRGNVETDRWDPATEIFLN
jgi:hypothetical protein